MRRTWSMSISKFVALSLMSVLTVVLVFLASTIYVASWLYDKNNEIASAYQEANERHSQLYSEILAANNALEQNLDSLAQEVSFKEELLKKAGIAKELLKFSKANEIFASREIGNYHLNEEQGRATPVSFQVGVPQSESAKLSEALAGANIRLRALYALPSGIPLQQADKAYISSGYGMRRHPVHGRRQFHHGIDLPLRVGDKVVSTAHGTVTFAGRTVNGGTTIRIDHEFGLSTAYAHLSEILVEKGDIVAKGQVIALGGNSGRYSTGPHIHYEINYLDQSINPYHFYDWNLDNFDKIFTREAKIKWEQIISALQQEQQAPEALSSLKALN